MPAEVVDALPEALARARDDLAPGDPAEVLAAVTTLASRRGFPLPDDIALDFAMPITFLAMIAPMLRTPAHLAACFVAILGSLVFAGLPSGLGLLIASPLGMAVGALVEPWSKQWGARA